MDLLACKENGVHLLPLKISHRVILHRRRCHWLNRGVVTLYPEAFNLRHSPGGMITHIKKEYTITS